MIEALKKTIYAGLGATVITKEKVEATLNDLVKTGKINAGEAAEMADKIVRESREEFTQAKEQMSGAFDTWFSQNKWASRKEFQELEARIDKLEKKNAQEVEIVE
jgi:polyhydroxyalkanoate synthesis regulator phasin